MQSLKKRKILVTGGSRGIGTEVARSLSKEGAFLAITGRNPGTLKESAASIEQESGVPVQWIAADLVDPASPKAIINRAADLLGGLDVLINNAGTSHSAPLEETNEESWDKIMQVNARTPYFLCKYALPHLRSSETPAIVQIASVVAFKGYELQSAYAASKHALLGFTKALSKEVQKDNIKVFTLAPGGVATDMVTSMRPDIDTSELIQPEEIAETILFLLRMSGNAMIDEISLRRFSKPGWL